MGKAFIGIGATADRQGSGTAQQATQKNTLQVLPRLLFLAAIVVLGAGLLGVGAATAAPGVKISSMLRLQPGWVRVYLQATDPPANAQYQLFPVCDSTAAANSIITTISNGTNLAFDIKDNPTWLADNGLPTPCHITQINIEMTGSTVILPIEVSATVDIAMDLPLSLLTPDNNTFAPTATSLPLAPSSVYAAYPPSIIVVKTADGHESFVEVEELPERVGGGTLGLRGLATFYGKSNGKSDLVFELGGGGEIQDGWGLDVVAQGIWRSPQLPVEISNPGHDSFAYTGTAEPDLLATPIPKVFPAPPLFASTDYQTFVLNNRGVPRCMDKTGCMAVQYSQAKHTLNAVNGALIGVLVPPPITVERQTTTTATLVVTPGVLPASRIRASAAVVRIEDPDETANLLAVAKSMAASRNIAAVQAMPTALASSSAHGASTKPSRNYALLAQSPQELQIQQLGESLGRPAGVVATNAPQCVVTSAGGVSEPPSKCAGMHSSTFACPTEGDAIAVEAIGAATSQAAALTATIPPYYEGRDNWFGTCASHAATQYSEALFDKFSDDLAIRRVIYVNNDPIVVPMPRVALSVSGGTVQYFDWDSTHTGDPPPPNNSGYNNNSPGYDSLPNFPEAYWPAREPNWSAWAANANKASGNASLCPGYWHSAFCMGQGHPGPGIYYSHSLQGQTLQGDPLSDPPWSLANHWFNYIQGAISLADRDKAIQSVMAEIQGGLPVFLSFSSGKTQNVPDGNGGIVTFYDGNMTWYLPPELAGCTTAQLDTVLGRTGGHAVNIIGYWVTGSPTAPDLIRSYFIIENNWGKDAGYHSFFFMNFAAFKYLANGLTTWRLDRACRSVACARRPPIRHTAIPEESITQLLYPPDPSGSMAANYKTIVDQAQAVLSGTTK
jgi:hypothetical protein